MREQREEICLTQSHSHKYQNLAATLPKTLVNLISFFNVKKHLNNAKLFVIRSSPQM